MAQATMRGFLLNDCEIEVDPRCVEYKLWKGKPPRPPARQLLEFFNKQIGHLKATTVLDIGAGVGDFSLLATLHPNLTVLAFEPQPLMQDLLRINLKLNSLTTQVQVFPCALADKDGQGRLKVPSDMRLGLACLGKPHRFTRWQTIGVIVQRLDSLDISKVDLAKIDVEGCELLVLRGGEQTLREHMPPMLLEYHRVNVQQFGYKLPAINDLLKDWGYRNFTMIGGHDLWVTV